MSVPKKVLCVLTSHEVGWYLPELAHPYLRFVKAGCLTEICSIAGGAAPIAEASIDLNDAENKEFYENPEMMKLTLETRPLEEYNGAEYDCVFFVGGSGTMWDFPYSSAVDRVGREVYEKGGIVGAVCHGPIALANIKLSDGSYLVAGKKVAGFTDEEEAFNPVYSTFPVHNETDKSVKQILTKLGGIHSQADCWQPYIQSDSRVMTGQNPASAGPLGEAIIQELIMSSS
eukprot:CAMPEP_0182427392 /NCGR_PEP_ID=MMETSP1167-20130531/17139_1 /TAXON_ID=2988 /ORGANISM="Mallomonas Sp, Strain CCMP3275" /LENGTH=229 /DNA_ID=CAMNT_0024609595 /DNA_START=63 /DNA_END=752 /DNA_ORIENTATION=-